MDEPLAGARIHILDSAAVFPYLQGSRILDVGTGPGLPGIPLAVLAPERRFCLLDANAKKTRFVQQAVIALELTNVEVVTARIENFRPETRFDTILSRAYTRLFAFLATARPVLAPHGLMLAMKGQCPGAELDEIAAANPQTIQLSVPGLEAKRTLVMVRT